jgi:hypothetical protein
MVLKCSVCAEEGTFDSDNDELLPEEGSSVSLKKMAEEDIGNIGKARGW